MSGWYRVPCLSVILALLFSALASDTTASQRVVVFAAASMTNALAEIEVAFEAETGHELVISLAASSALARQIQQGAPADVFISANPDWMDVLERDGLLEPGTRFDLLNNRIVMIAHGAEASPVTLEPDLDIVAMLKGGRLAMALVDAVPAGIYGKAALEHFGLWAVVQPSVAQADNVRAALALVARGEAPYGVVYATDAVAEERVSVVATFPENAHPPIVYPASVIAGRQTAAVQAFVDYLRGAEAQAVFERQGFAFAKP